MTIWAIIKFQFEGWHRWKDAPETDEKTGYSLKFLRDLHRHVFHVEVWVQQTHSERDIEYLSFKNWLTDPVQDVACLDWPIQKKFGITEEDSCETMGTKIKSFIKDFYPGRKIKVFVFEDNENGACVE
jgi:hypothetical protein